MEHGLLSEKVIESDAGQTCGLSTSSLCQHDPQFPRTKILTDCFADQLD
jgi:hypothetical protein